MHRPSLPPRKYSWYSFLLEAESTPGPQCGRNFSDTIGNRTRDLPVCRAVPQPTAPPRAPSGWEVTILKMYIYISVMTIQMLLLNAKFSDWHRNILHNKLWIFEYTFNLNSHATSMKYGAQDWVQTVNSHFGYDIHSETAFRLCWHSPWTQLRNIICRKRKMFERCIFIQYLLLCCVLEQVQCKYKNTC